jgi:hypothetical protein
VVGVVIMPRHCHKGAATEVNTQHILWTQVQWRERRVGRGAGERGCHCVPRSTYNDGRLPLAELFAAASTG